ncbi:transcriptional regulator [Frankia sp. EI5c]|uniref:FadR/GntR family transcriptional regulator n=1 Tax=Frankia sp. EI5c TaxID=683316 RepID=UPI0007C3D991|nr:FCD domain-containing protein [Frankia sp. EI5c]OAA28153.1 transcriptional regulator [Frankia sp. EI5c]
MLSVERVRPAYVQVAAQLQDLIVRGDLTAGQRLPVEAELSTMFGVSRSTVREALRLLSSRHLVETRRGVRGGTFVAAPDAGLLGGFLETSLGLLSGAGVISTRQLIEANEVLEIAAARFAALRRSPEQLAAIRRAVFVAHRTDDPVERYEGGGGFHAEILAACGNPLLGLVAAPVRAVLRRRFQPSCVTAEFWERGTRRHEEIYEALELGDPERSGDLMRAHLAELQALTSQPADPDADAPGQAPTDTDTEAAAGAAPVTKRATGVTIDTSPAA